MNNNQYNNQYNQYGNYPNNPYGGNPMPPVGPAPAPQKNNTAKIIIIVVAAVLFVLAILGGILLAVTKGWIGNKDKLNQQIQTEYTSYLQEVILPDLAPVDAEHISTSQEGVYAALMKDVNNDQKDDMVVAYAEKNGNRIDYKLDYYSYESSDKQVTKQNTVLINDAETTNDENETGGLADVPDGEWIEPFDIQEVMYSVEYNGVTYIILEYLSAYEGYNYEAHVYTVQNEVLTEVANLFADEYTEAFVYSAMLPEGMTIDNSDFDYSEECFRELINSGASILYYNCDIEEMEYHYHTYYSNEVEAVKDFFRHFGVDKQFIEIFNWDTYEMNTYSNVDYMYSYLRYFDYINGKETPVDKFVDYTGVHGIPTTTPESTTTPTTQPPTDALEAKEEDFRMLEDLLDNSFNFVQYIDGVGNSETVDFSTYTEADVIAEYFIPPCTYDYYFGETGTFDYDYGNPKGYLEMDGLRLNADKADWIIENVFNVPVNREEVGHVTSEWGTWVTHYYDGNDLYVQSFEGGWVEEEEFEVKSYNRLPDGSYEIIVSMDEYGPAYDDYELCETFEYVITAKLKEDKNYGRYWSFQKYTVTLTNTYY